MKYHSNFSVISISLLMLLIFSIVIIGFAFVYSISSPTEYLTQQALESINLSENFDISFSSIDRDIGNKIVVNDVLLKIDESEIIKFDTITVYQGLLSILKSIFTGKGSFEIEADSGDIYINDEIFKTLNFSSSPTSSEPNILSKYNYSFLLKNINLNYQDQLIVSNISTSGSIKENFYISDVNAIIDKIAYEDITLINTSLVLRQDSNSNYLINLNINNASGVYQDISFNVNQIALETNIDLNQDFDLSALPIQLSFASLYGVYSNIYINASNSFISHLDNKLTGAFSSINASYDDFKIDTGLLIIDLGFIQERINIDLKHSDTLSIKNKDGLLGNIKDFSILGYYDKNLQLFLDAKTINLPIVTKLADPILTSTIINNTRISLYSNLTSIDIDAEMEGILDVTHDVIDRVSTNVVLSGHYDFDDGIENLYISLPSISIGKFPSKSSATINLKDKSIIELNVNYDTSLNIEAVISENIDLNLQFSSFNIGALSSLFDYYTPFLTNYISEDTVVNGSLDINGALKDSQIPFLGDINYSIAISNINFNDSYFGLATTLNAHITQTEFDIQNFTLTTEWVRAAYSGNLSFETFLPEGELKLNLTDSGDDIFKLAFSLSEDKEYFFKANIPLLDPANLSGKVNWATENIIRSNGILETRNSEHVFEADLNILERNGRFAAQGLVVSLDYSDELLINASFDNFSFRNQNLPEDGLIDGLINFSLDFVSQDFSIKSSEFIIQNYGFVDIQPKISFFLDVDNKKTAIREITVSDIYGELTGELIFGYDNYNLALNLSNDDQSESVLLSLVPFDKLYTGTLELNNINLERFGFNSAILNSTLIGFGGTLDDIKFSGNVNISSTDEINYPLSINSSIEISSTEILLSSLYYMTDNLSINSDSLSYSSLTGELNSDISLDLVLEHLDRDIPIRARVSLSSKTHQYDNLFNGIRNIIFDRDYPLSLTLDIAKVDIDDGSLTINDKSIFVEEKADGGANISGNFINGSLKLENKTFDINITDNEIIKGHYFGNLSNDNFKIEAESFEIDLSLLNLLLNAPIFGFYKGSIGMGNLVLLGPFSDFKLYGEGLIKDCKLFVWFLPNQIVEMHNVYVSAWDNFATTAEMTCLVYDKDTMEINNFTGTFSTQLSPQNILDYYAIDLDIPDGQSILIRFPIISANIDLVGRTSGTFGLNYGTSHVDLWGDLKISDFTISVGLHPYEEWAAISANTINTYNVTVGDNCKFIFPLGDNPIITAYIREGAVFGLNQNYSNHSLSFTGELPIRSGEFFYFQKNFYITEGSISFNENTQGLDPIINLRARLRDFDANNEKVDIYLNLINATLSNISPVFESSPQKSTEEILSILGDAILPTNAYGEVNAASLASLLSTGIDAISRLGIINTQSNGLTESIRTALGLDVFSLHTSIVENIIIDTMQVNSIQTNTLSPLARYLDNTSAYIGKYLSESIYLQGLIHLSAITDQNTTIRNDRNNFLASDLSIDLELSMEWSNPLGVFTVFTQPRNISLFDVMDSVGFTFSKRITF